MLVTDTSMYTTAVGLASAEIIDSSVRLNFKNGATFTLIPVVENGVVTGYMQDYLQSKDNKAIAKLQKKMEVLQAEIESIKANGKDASDEDTEDSEDKSGSDVTTPDVTTPDASTPDAE